MRMKSHGLNSAVASLEAAGDGSLGIIGDAARQALAVVRIAPPLELKRTSGLPERPRFT